MNSRYRSGDYEARHTNPVWGARANFVIAADIADDERRGEWEQIWARRVAENQFEVCCIPYFAYGLALGDLVETDDDHVITRVLKRSGRATFRAWFGDTADPKYREQALAIVVRAGCAFEWSSENLLAIDAETVEQAKHVAEQLSVLEGSGMVSVEVGNEQA